MLSSYRIQCMWKPDVEPAARRGIQRGALLSPSGYASGGSKREGSHGVGGLGGIGTKLREGGYRVIAGLTLYKVCKSVGRGNARGTE